MAIGANLSADDLWRLMQRIETLHHQAELLEEEAVSQPISLRDEKLKLASECRAFATQLEQHAPGTPSR